MHAGSADRTASVTHPQGCIPGPNVQHSICLCAASRQAHNAITRQPFQPQVVGQKIRGGSLAPRSELQLEVAEACLRDVHVQASRGVAWLPPRLPL